MMYMTHASFAVLLGLILMLFLSIPMPLLFFAIAVFASLLPDIDTEHSFIGRKLLISSFLFLTQHRGFLHSLTFLFILTTLLTLIKIYMVLPFLMGYGSHLVLDSFTVSGIRPFWPSRRKVKGRLRTGSFHETLLFIAFLVASAVVVLLIL